MDKFPQIGGGALMPDSSKMKVLPGIRYNPAKPLLFGRRYTLRHRSDVYERKAEDDNW